MIAAAIESILKSLLKEAFIAMASEVRGSTFCSTRSMIRSEEEKSMMTKNTTKILCTSLMRLRDWDPPAPRGAGNKNSAGRRKMEPQ